MTEQDVFILGFYFGGGVGDLKITLEVLGSGRLLLTLCLGERESSLLAMLRDPDKTQTLRQNQLNSFWPQWQHGSPFGCWEHSLPDQAKGFTLSLKSQDNSKQALPERAVGRRTSG